jgi:hypothetical protein
MHRADGDFPPIVKNMCCCQALGESYESQDINITLIRNFKPHIFASSRYPSGIMDMSSGWSHSHSPLWNTLCGIYWTMEKKKRWRRIEVFICFLASQDGLWVCWGGKSSSRMLWARVVSSSVQMRSETRILEGTNSPWMVIQIPSLSDKLTAQFVRRLFEAVSSSALEISPDSRAILERMALV